MTCPSLVVLFLPPLTLHLSLSLQQIMDSMTQVLAQTVYDLNVQDLPLDRLELEDQHRLQQKTRIKSQDHITSANPRTTSFTTINVVSNRRDLVTYTPPVNHQRKLGDVDERSSSSVGDIGAKRKRMMKARTEDPTDSPPMVSVSSVKRFSTPDHAPMLRKLQPRPLLTVPTIDEEVVRGESPELVTPPRRSSSSIGQISRKLSDGGGNVEEIARSNLLDPGSISSPGATSLPPEMLFDAIPVTSEHEPLMARSSVTATHDSVSTGEEGLQMQTLEAKDAKSAEMESKVSRRKSGQDELDEDKTVDSVIVNFHAKSTSPEPVPLSPSTETTNLIKPKDRTKSAAHSTSTRGNGEAEGKEGGKGHSKGKEGSKWTDLFHWRSKSMHGVKPTVAPDDLVLTNKGFSKDSLTPEPQVAPKYKKKPLCRSDSDTSALRSKIEAMKEAKSQRSVHSVENEESVRSRPLHRSLSDSCIPILVTAEITGAPPSSSLDAKALDSTNLLAQRSHISLRRVVSSGATPPRARDRVMEESLRDKVLDDEFSASIIPQSHDVIQKMTSPPRHMPVTRTKLMRSATVAEDSLDETNRRAPPSAVNDERESTSKSPPLSVRSPTSPVQPLPGSSPQGGGWTPIVAAVVWFRMLRILGDINAIQDPYIHAEAMACLQDIWKALSTVSMLYMYIRTFQSGKGAMLT